MMHGREKSDSAILAVKPPNGAGVPAEEGVERRAEAEGNAGQDRTHRTQDRESVSQGLERVRHVARTRRTRKKERRPAPDGLLRPQATSRSRRGRADVAGLRGGPRSPDQGPARAGPPGSVPGAAGPPRTS